MMTSVTAKLLAIDQRLKALDPQSYNRIGTVWRTKDSLSLKLGLLSLHLCSVALFLAPIGFGVWFMSMMSEH